MAGEGKYSVSLGKIISGNQFGTVYTPADPASIYVFSKEVNRPALMLTGHDNYFDSRRIQFIGLAEYAYLQELGDAERERSLDGFFAKRPVAVIVTRSLEISDLMRSLALKYGVPLLTTSDSTSGAMAQLISFLGVELADRITRHGVLVDVAGEGVLITGESGVGKSETAVELIKRGHRLIADDAVEIRRVSEKTLVGAAPDNIRHFIELRGVGIINARETFGTAAVKATEKIDMVIHLEQMSPDKVYDRLGMDYEYIDILGLSVPAYVIPVKPGRNLAIIIETAAIRFRQKQMGYDAAEDLMRQLGIEEGEIEPGQKRLDVWHS